MKRLTSLIALLAMALLFCSASVIAAEEQDWDFKLLWDVGYYTRYIGGSGSTAYDKEVFQQSITGVLIPLGLYFGVWDSFSPNGSLNGDYGDEVDYFAGIKRQIGEFTFKLEYVFANIYDLESTEGDLHVISLRTDFPDLYGATPFLKMEQDIPDNIGDGGFLYRAGFCYTLNAIEELPLNLAVSLAGHDGAYGRRPEKISSARLEVSTDICFRKATITPMVNFQKCLGYSREEGGMSEDKIWAGINVSIPF